MVRVGRDDVIDDVIIIIDGTDDDTSSRYTLNCGVVFSYLDRRRTFTRRRPIVYCVWTLTGIWFMSRGKGIIINNTL